MVEPCHEMGYFIHPKLTSRTQSPFHRNIYKLVVHRGFHFASFVILYFLVSIFVGFPRRTGDILNIDSFHFVFLFPGKLT